MEHDKERCMITLRIMKNDSVDKKTLDVLKGLLRSSPENTELGNEPRCEEALIVILQQYAVPFLKHAKIFANELKEAKCP
jgi:hypothetical protein